MMPTISLSLKFFEENGCPAGVISVCIPSHSFEENETALCGDVPQDEVVKELERQGIAKETGKSRTAVMEHTLLSKLPPRRLQPKCTLPPPIWGWTLFKASLSITLQGAIDKKVLFSQESEE